MFVAVVFLFLLCQTNGDDIVRYRCVNGTESSVTFTPALNGIEGRYTAELCMKKNPNVIKWNVNLMYYNKPAARCHNIPKPDLVHSVIKEDITAPTNCTNVCYSADFDLIFGGCYNVHSEFEAKRRTTRPLPPRPTDTFVFITNNITMDMYENNKPHVSFIPHQDMVTLHWYLGIPVTFYDVMIAPKKNNSEEYSEEQTKVTDQCSVVRLNEVRCQLQLAEACYQATFQHHSIWTSAFNEQASVDFTFCHSLVAPPALWGGSARVWWASGAALVLVTSLVAAALGRRALRTRTYHKHVLQAWRTQRECEVPRPLEARAQNILVLYAREGELAQRAVDKLKELLTQHTGCQVLDLFSAEVTSLSAAAPGAWLRGAVTSPQTRVVLLQSPGAAALYRTRLADTLHLCEPLLGRRAMYRRPQFGDQLLQLALRLVAESPAAHHDYSKYYLATYGTLETDIVPALVPYRRYVLPAAIGALLRDLSAGPAAPAAPAAPAGPAAPDPAALDEFAQRVEDFVTHVRANPDYLMDELIIM